MNMNKVLIKLHNATAKLRRCHHTKKREDELIIKRFEQGTNYNKLITDTLNELKLYPKRHADFGTKYNDIGVSSAIYCVIDKESEIWCILYKPDPSVIANNRELKPSYSITSDMKTKQIVNLLDSDDIDFFLIDIDSELHVFDTMSISDHRAIYYEDGDLLFNRK